MKAGKEIRLIGVRLYKLNMIQPPVKEDIISILQKGTKRKRDDTTEKDVCLDLPSFPGVILPGGS